MSHPNTYYCYIWASVVIKSLASCPTNSMKKSTGYLWIIGLSSKHWLMIDYLPGYGHTALRLIKMALELLVSIK
jgi:hypothetical protein